MDTPANSSQAAGASSGAPAQITTNTTQGGGSDIGDASGLEVFMLGLQALASQVQELISTETALGIKLSTLQSQVAQAASAAEETFYKTYLDPSDPLGLHLYDKDQVQSKTEELNELTANFQGITKGFQTPIDSTTQMPGNLMESIKNNLTTGSTMIQILNSITAAINKTS